MPSRILVVDDEEHWRKELRDILVTMKYQVDDIEGFEEAQLLMRHNRYDLALIDVCLDQSDPSYLTFQKFCLFLRENFLDVPIIAVSGAKIDPTFMFNLREQHGVTDFVSKIDFSLPDFRRRIEALIQKKNMISILFLAADPTDESRLRLGEEWREIQEKLKLSKLRDRFRLELPQLSIRPADISQALLDVQPKIVHFSGHGTAEGALYFENKIGKTHFVKPEALAALFEQFVNQVNCVVLNACYSEIQAKAIGKHIHYVIGMNQEIGDEAAIAFTIGFYQGLGAGRTVEEAFKLGCVQIGLHDIPEHLTPVLVTKTLSR